MRLALVASLIAALIVGACGRRGAPERPPIEGPTATIDPVDETSLEVPDRDFILDPLL
ncbi:MAG: hypothetical protein AcusKO_14920 [Acuticoccus sp.]